MTQHDISSNLNQIRENLAQATSAGGREKEACQLVAVSKTRTSEEIISAIEAGQRVFGENRVQEAVSKWPEIKASFPDVKLHLIGALQSNKVKPALQMFDVIETLDRPSLAKALAREDVAVLHPHLRLYIQVNTGGEPQKGGVLPVDLESFIAMACNELSLPVVGLMCIPPVDEEPALHFALLKKYAQRFGFKELSMGMSSDYEIAAEIGATSVRVGTAIFGERRLP